MRRRKGRSNKEREGFESRSDAESADEAARRGRGNFRAAARKLSVTESLPFRIREKSAFFGIFKSGIYGLLN
jgi:hypothetical protein